MSGRAERLQRLLAIRMLTEDLDRNVLQSALAAVALVENTLAALDNAVTESKISARTALADGDRSEWMMADAQGEVAGWDRSKLKRLLATRTEAAGTAMGRFLESRREHEQVKQLVKDSEQATRVDDLRRAQAASDDWFLSKRSPENA
jgi:hypothetical protein